MRRRGRRGQTLVEFAIAFPIFIFILLALFDLGRAVFMLNSLTNAAREGARLAIVNQDKPLVLQRAQQTAFGVGISSTPDQLVRYFKKGPAQDPTANAPCDNSDADHALSTGCVAVVTPQASWQAITPMIGGLIGPISLTARTDLAIEFVCPTSEVPAFSTAAGCPKQP